MTLVQTNRASFTSAEAITSATQTTITRTSATDGLPGDSNGPASGEYAVVFTDGNGNFEIAYVTGGQGTTTLTLQRAAELIGGTQTALSSVASGTTFYAVATAAGLQPASYDTTVLTKLSLAPVAYWPLDDPVGSTTAADKSGNGYTLSVNGTVTFGEPSVVPTDSETSAKGDGSTGYLITSAAPALLPVGTSPFTWLVAVTPPAGSGAAWMGLAGQSGSTGFGSAATNDAIGLWTPGHAGGISSVQAWSGSTHLCGAVYNGNSLLCYLDGTRANINAGNIGNIGTSSGNVVVLAGGSVGGGNPGPFNFSNFPIGRVAIFAGVLTPKDWALLMQAFTGVS